MGIQALVIERSASTVGAPRAVTIDDESLRTVQATGLIGEVLPHVVQGYGEHYYSRRGKVFARIEPSLSSMLGQQVLVDNRPGAGGNLATELAARVKPDG